MTNIMQMNGIMEKLTILSDAAKYDVACTSSGVHRGGDGKNIGNAFASGICHAFTGDGRCISLLKILFTNECIYDCKYCVNRSSNDNRRATFTPDEVCQLTVEFYRRNYIEGLFLSSGIIKSPDYTMGLLYETLFLLRTKYRFNGYVHIKGIPGASADVIEMVGYLADRMSVNLELPTAEGLRQVAPNKVRKNILSPMRQIQNGIKESRQTHGVTSMKSRVYIDEKSYYNQLAEMRDSYARLQDYQKGVKAIRQKNADAVAEQSWNFTQMQTAETVAKKNNIAQNFPVSNRSTSQITRNLSYPDRYFVPAGQSTQMIIGATGESDYQIMSVTEALYRKFEMKRVFYSAFINVNEDASLPAIGKKPPLLREHRLYQADWLLRFYGFRAEELLDEQAPSFDPRLDPKCCWALRHPDFFPVEVNRADYEALLRVPGLGVVSARRILTARRTGPLRLENLPKLGVVMKRAQYFLTANGRMADGLRFTQDSLLRNLIAVEQSLLPQPEMRQLSLFDDAV